MSGGPLSGLKVYDFSQVVAGPYGGVLLADYGADVVSIEPPGGAAERDILYGSTFPNVSHNKRSIVVDLKHEDAGPFIERMAKDADVVLHNYTPGTMERLNCGYETLREYNEELVFCSLTGFGENGPYRDRRGYDPIAQAMSGLMSVTGEPDRKPSRVGASLIDYGTGTHLAFAVMAAIYDRDRTGEGRKIEVSLLDTAATFMGYLYTYYSRYGREPVRRGSSLDLNASQGIFTTADDPVYAVFGEANHWRQLCEAIGREEWLDDPQLETRSARNENREYLHETVDAAFSEYSREELLDLLLGANVPAAPVNSIPEAIEDEQLRLRGTVRSIEDFDGTEVVIGGTPVHFSGFSPEVESPPELAEHTGEVLAELGFSDHEVERFVEDGVTPTDG